MKLRKTIRYRVNGGRCQYLELSGSGATTRATITVKSSAMSHRAKRREQMPPLPALRSWSTHEQALDQWNRSPSG